MFSTILSLALLCQLSGTSLAETTAQKLYNLKDGVYPAAYPFSQGGEGEVSDWTFEHNWIPNNTADEATDNGGYRYFGYFKADMNKWDFSQGGFCFVCDSGPLKYFLIVEMKRTSGVLPLPAWNCTKNFNKPEMFGGEVNKQKICVAGECCKDFYGLHRKNDDADKRQLDIDTKVSAGLCRGLIPEELYCVHMTGNVVVNCLQTYPGPTLRTYPLLRCWDSFFWYFVECPVFKAAGVEPASIMEPIIYRSMQAGTDKLLNFALYYNPDRVCLPYQYFASVDVEEESSTMPSSSLLSFCFLAVTAFRF